MGAAVLAKHPPAKIPFRPSFTVAVNGQSQVFPENGPPPRFTVTPAEDLRIDVDMVVPAHHKVTALWLGISGVVMGPPSDRALPVNASSDSLPAGQHPENVVVRGWVELPTFRFQVWQMYWSAWLPRRGRLPMCVWMGAVAVVAVTSALWARRQRAGQPSASKTASGSR
jgi:hypothetical protein